MNLSLFDLPEGKGMRERLGPGTWLLRSFATACAADLLEAVRRVAEASPFRHLETPGGYRMSVAMTSCGEVGWVSDRTGYRYDAFDPLSDRIWPEMPEVFLTFVRRAAEEAGYLGYVPDTCLINRYEPGAKLTLHQDKDERDFSQPIVSVSLGLPAVFLWGGADRGEATERLTLRHGDVLVWGGEDRLRYHGVLPLKEGRHPETERARLNLTFRRAR